MLESSPQRCYLHRLLPNPNALVAFSALTRLDGRKGIRPVKIWGDGGGGHWLVRMEWRPAGWSVCLPLLIFPCTIKSRSSLLAPAHPGGPRKRAVKWLCACGVVVLESRCWGSNAPSARSLVMGEEIMRSGHWLISVLCVSFSAFTLGWVTGRTSGTLKTWATYP